MRPKDAWESSQTCRKCDGGSLSRVHRATLFDFILSGFGCYPFTCSNCHRRSSRTDPARLAGGICVGILACGFLMLAMVDLHSLYVQREQDWKATQLEMPQPAVTAPSVPYKYAPVPSPAPDHTGVLTNADIVDMVKGGMSDGFIRNLMHEVENNFAVDSQSLIDLKDAHVPESVILTMVEVVKRKENKGRADSSAGNSH
ncbi:MAG: hypothetical protein P4L56_30500 [Candidatus Sulfopaludibacter sp.]|nr:hypothetical protein [Candidatus Sulfopaludibacter sp.]